jgi:hypothetical protein
MSDGVSAFLNAVVTLFKTSEPIGTIWKVWGAQSLPEAPTTDPFIWERNGCGSACEPLWTMTERLTASLKERCIDQSSNRTSVAALCGIVQALSAYPEAPTTYTFNVVSKWLVTVGQPLWTMTNALKHNNVSQSIYIKSDLYKFRL